MTRSLRNSTDEEPETLQRWAGRVTSSQVLAQRCRIVLGCAAGKTNKEVAAEVGAWPQMVGVWRRRFVESRLDGLADEPRPGAPRTITDEAVEEVIVATFGTPTQRRHALVAGVDGGRDRIVEIDGGPDLKSVPTQTTSDRHVQDQQ